MRFQLWLTHLARDCSSLNGRDGKWVDAAVSTLRTATLGPGR